MDEAFDCWDAGKRDEDYHLWFEAWWQRDVASMVLRDRNHARTPRPARKTAPCVCV